MENRVAVLLYNQMSEKPKEDEMDVIRQMNHISRALKQLAYTAVRVPFSIDLAEAIQTLEKIRPKVVFNLVEMVEGTGKLLYFGPSILNFLHIPYTGVPLEAMFLTTSKILTKKQLKLLNINTSGFYMMDELHKLLPGRMYIVKPIWEDGSLGLDEHCIFSGDDSAYIEKIKHYHKNSFFIEDYIEGREFNLSILGGKEGPQVMPPAEILFVDYPEGKHKIVGYNAKWTEDSFEYNHTPRTFKYPKQDEALLARLKMMALQCWHGFELKGYVRVDFRVDKEGTPYVLEINGNPCISPESGYVAATKRAGLKFHQVVERIIEDALTN
jgi:D-alanine-D-alanine ligase